MTNPPDDKNKGYNPGDTDLRLGELERKILREKAEQAKDRQTREEHEKKLEEIEKAMRKLNEKQDNGDQ